MKSTPSIVRVNNKEINSIFGVHAALSELKTASELMEKRFRAIPNGWRDLRCTISILTKLCGELMRTVPPEKLGNLQLMSRRMKFKLIIGPQATKTEEDECVVTMKDLHTLAMCSYEQCKLCNNWEKCNQCPLGQTLDRVLMYDRNGQSWATADIMNTK